MQLFKHMHMHLAYRADAHTVSTQNKHTLTSCSTETPLAMHYGEETLLHAGKHAVTGRWCMHLYHCLLVEVKISTTQKEGGLLCKKPSWLQQHQWHGVVYKSACGSVMWGLWCNGAAAAGASAWAYRAGPVWPR